MHVCARVANLLCQWQRLRPTLLVLPAEWEEELAQYSKEHPRMRVVDSFDAIRPIMSRFSMLAPLDQDGIRLQVLHGCCHAAAACRST